MARIILKGQILSIGEIEVLKESKKQSIILFIPGYKDDFGRPKGRDGYWKLDFFNDNIAKFNLLPNEVGLYVTCSLYLNSNRLEVEGKDDLYFINATLIDIQYEPVK